MHPHEITMIREILPEDMVFDYYPDRESAWLLSELMPDTARVSDLKATPVAKLLSRPLVKPVVAACGGTLSRADLWPLAHAERAMRMPDPSAAAQAALDGVFQTPWQDFGLSFTTWTGAQMTREGGNLVVQLGFPSDHAALMGRFFTGDVRWKFEEDMHPVRLDGRPTLAWARLDLDLDAGQCLIEEIQSDWLRFVTEERVALEQQRPRSRDLRQTRAYEAELIARYARVWSTVMMLSVLALVRQEFAIREVFLHRPDVGYALKGMWGPAPPRSLYTQLPKAFCFRPTMDVPRILTEGGTGRARNRNRVRRILRSHQVQNGPVFWKLQFPG